MSVISIGKASLARFHSSRLKIRGASGIDLRHPVNARLRDLRTDGLSCSSTSIKLMSERPGI
jgi:hypothetical protein